MASTRKDIPVGGVWLLSDGQDVVVLIERENVWYEALRERFPSPQEGIISHHISPSGIEALDLSKKVAWLDESYIRVRADGRAVLERGGPR